MVVSVFLFLFLASSNLMPARSLDARRGLVATDHGRCSAIGRDILKEGGHAVDAAVAAAVCLGVLSPASSGIGGGAFMLIRTSDGKVEAYDMRETAPLEASKNMYGGNEALKASGGLSIAVPGELLGLETAWKKYGRIPWNRLITPAARMSEKGFKVSPYLHMQMVVSESSIMADGGLRSVFTSNGSLLKAGDLCRNPKLGQTLRMVSVHGTEVLYNGSVGVGLVKDVRKAGGIMTLEDLRDYRVKVRTPVVMNFMGYQIFSMPPPSAGGASLALMLNILSQYQDLSNISDSLMAHRMIEALKNALAVKMNLGDPDFVNVKKVVKDMLSIDFAAQLRKTIFDNMTFGPSHYGGRWNPIPDHGTSHISIVDMERNAVSMTTTINSYFGSKFLSPTTGIILNNEMDDFSMPRKTSEIVLPPMPRNFVHPHKRSLSSMTPSIVVQGGHLKSVMGASGGSNIIAAVAEVLLNHLSRGKDPLSSVLAPRLYHQFIPNVVLYENWTVPTGEHFEVPQQIRIELQNKEHVLQGIAGGTICQFIVHELRSPNQGWLTGVSDPRKGGAPAGY